MPELLAKLFSRGNPVSDRMYANLAKPNRNRVNLERQIDLDGRKDTGVAQQEQESAAKNS
jgi:hypothetical protein